MKNKKNVIISIFVILLLFILSLIGTIFFIKRNKDDMNLSTNEKNLDIYVALYKNGTLVFNNKDKFEEDKISKKYGNIKDYDYETNEDNIIWNEDIDKIKNVEILNTIYPTTTKQWFNECELIENIDVSKINTSNVIDMSYMFCNCKNLSSLDIT